MNSNFKCENQCILLGMLFAICIFKKTQKLKNQKRQQKNQTVGISNSTFENLFLEDNLKQKNSLCTKYSLKCMFKGGEMELI